MSEATDTHSTLSTAPHSPAPALPAPTAAPALLPASPGGAFLAETLLDDAVLERRHPGLLSVLAAVERIRRGAVQPQPSFWQRPLAGLAVILLAARQSGAARVPTPADLARLGLPPAALCVLTAGRLAAWAAQLGLPGSTPLCSPEHIGVRPSLPGARPLPRRDWPGSPHRSARLTPHARHRRPGRQ